MGQAVHTNKDDKDRSVKRKAKLASFDVHPKKRKYESKIDDCDVGVKSTSNNLILEVDLTSLAFVNREQACRSLMISLVEQKISEDHGLLPILSQHFGSGKTRLVNEFRKALKERGLVHISTHPQVEDNINKSILVEMSLNRASLTKSIEDDLTFPNGGISQFFLRELGRVLELSAKRSCDSDLVKTCRIVKRVGAYWQDEDKEECFIISKLNSCKTLTSFLLEYSNQNLYPLLILVDEASILEQRYMEGHLPFVYLWENLFKPTMGSYQSNIRTPGIYFVVCGTSSVLTKLGRGLLRESTKLISPTRAIHITLEMLKVEHIMEIFEKTCLSRDNKINVRIFTNNFCNIGINYEYFCKVVFEYTMGIPRLVLYVLKSLIRYVNLFGPIDLSTRAKIDSTFAEFESRTELFYLKTAKELYPFYENIATSENKTKLCMLFTLGVLGIPIPVQEEFLSEIDLIHDLNVAVEFPMTCINETPFELIHMYIPKFTMIKASKLKHMQSISVLSTLPPKYYRYVDKGDLLEELFLDTILTRIFITIKMSKGTKWHDIHPIFAFSNLLVDMDVKLDSSCPVVYLPKIVGVKNKNTPKALSFSKKHPWHFNMSYLYWEQLYESLMTKSVIGHPAPKSKSSDFVISVDGTTSICIACKNFNFSSKFTLRMLQDEIDKASLLEKKIVLFIFATQLSLSLIKCQNNTPLRLTEGKWKFDNKDLKFSKLLSVPTVNERAKGTNFVVKTIQVFPNMEVIVLEQTFNSFFMKKDIDLLKEISTSKTYPKFDLVEQWIQSLQ